MKTLKLLSVFLALLIITLPICFANELNLQYDANGNLITGDGMFRVYNSLNQLSKVYNGTGSSGLLLEEYTYHPVEERILLKKVYNNDSSLKETVYYVDENFVRVVNSSGSYDFTYVKQEGQLVAQLNPDGSKMFIHGNNEGSSSVITDESGAVIENTTYSAFGEIVFGGQSTSYGYEGKEQDSVTGDTDFNFRKYKADWGLFSQPDSLIQNVYDPQSLNRYSFERNNPLRYEDKTGHLIPAALGLFFLGLGVSAFLQLAMESEKAKYDALIEEPNSEDILNKANNAISGGETGFEALQLIKTSGTSLGVLGKTSNVFGIASNTVYFAEMIYYSNKAQQINSYFDQVQSNPNLNVQSKSQISKSMINTERSGNSVQWYYDSTTSTYQYWVGNGKPSSSNMKPIPTTKSGSTSSGSCRAVGKAHC